MPQPKSKSKQVMEYLYCYAIQKGTSEVIEAVVPYGKIGMILWEIGHHIYKIMSNVSEEDRLAILNEIQQANSQEIDRLSNDLSNDPNVIYPIALSDDERKAIARGIYQTLRQMPKGKSNPQQILQSINQGLFAGRNVLSVQNVNASHTQSLGSAVLKTLVNGSEFGQRQSVQFLGQYPKIKGFEIKGILGEGAYARVYLANEQLGNGKWRTCALKVGVIESEKRFKREVEIMKALNHPHILNCWHTGRFQEQGVNKYWISMPNMGVLTLEHLILGNVLDLETKLLVLMQMVDGLEALHQKTIVHRDLKPSNCLISVDFELKISDFGLSKDLYQHIDDTHSRNAYAIGTPAYMSPENINGDIGYYSDVWAFGVIAFELLSGNLPWGRDINPLVLIGNIQHKDIEVRKKLTPFKIHSKLIDIIEKCLKKDISQRYRNGVELKNAFYNVAKEERNRIRYYRFKDSWKILVEKKLIENFIIQQVRNGISSFQLETFLSMPEVSNLPLALDHEKLANILDVLSQVSMEIQLGDVLRKIMGQSVLKDTKEMMKKKKEELIERIDREMADALGKISSTISPADLAQKISKLLEDSNRKKAKVEHQYIEWKHKSLVAMDNSKDILVEKILVLTNRLKIEITKELKDFDPTFLDQIKKDKDKENKERLYQEEKFKIEENNRLLEKKRLWRMRSIMMGEAILIMIAGLWIWHRHVEDKNRIHLLSLAEQERIKQEQEKTTKAEIKQQHIQQEDEIKTLKDDLQLILIKGGSFMMGSKDGSLDEKPIHKVIVKDFYMSKTEITVGQYRKCVQAKVCSEPHWDDGSCYIWDGLKYSQGILGQEFRGKNQPIVCIDWHQARSFSKWVGGDLPSEVQWEYASRSRGKDIKYPWGNKEPTCDMTNFNYDCHKVTTPVCSKKGGHTLQNLCDIGGNVWEWVLDEWHASYREAPNDDRGWCNDSNCEETNTSVTRIFRGGSWNFYASFLRSTYRDHYSSAYRSTDVGFRVSTTTSMKPIEHHQ